MTPDLALPGGGSIPAGSASAPVPEFWQTIKKNAHKVGSKIREAGQRVMPGVKKVGVKTAAVSGAVVGAGIATGAAATGAVVRAVSPKSELRTLFWLGLLFHYILGPFLLSLNSFSAFGWLNFIFAVYALSTLNRISNGNNKTTHIIVVFLFFLFEMGIFYGVAEWLPLFFDVAKQDPALLSLFSPYWWPFWSLLAMWHPSNPKRWMPFAHIVVLILLYGGPAFADSAFGETAESFYRSRQQVEADLKEEGGHSPVWWNLRYASFCSTGIQPGTPEFQTVDKDSACMLMMSGQPPPREEDDSYADFIATKMKDSNDRLSFSMTQPTREISRSEEGEIIVRSTITVTSPVDSVDVRVGCAADNGEERETGRVVINEQSIENPDLIMNVKDELRNGIPAKCYLPLNFLTLGENSVTMSLRISGISYVAEYRAFIASEDRHNEIIRVMEDKYGKRFPEEAGVLSTAASRNQLVKDLQSYYTFYYDKEMGGSRSFTGFLPAGPACYAPEKIPQFVVAPEGMNKPIITVSKPRGRDGRTYEYNLDEKITWAIGMDTLPSRIKRESLEVEFGKVMLVLPKGIAPIDGHCIFESTPIEQPGETGVNAYELKENYKKDFFADINKREGNSLVCETKLIYDEIIGEGEESRSIKHLTAKLVFEDMRISYSVQGEKIQIQGKGEDYYGRIDYFPIQDKNAVTKKIEDTWGDDRFTGGAHRHEGTDIMAREDAVVVAVLAGRVRYAGCNHPMGGNRVFIDQDGGIGAYYAHLSDIFVKPGDYVKAGDPIGLVGDTVGCRTAKSGRVCSGSDWTALPEECKDVCDTGSKGAVLCGIKGTTPFHLHFCFYRKDEKASRAFNPYRVLKQKYDEEMLFAGATRY